MTDYTLQTLKSAGYSPADFHIRNPDDTGRTFEYFLFTWKHPELMDVWDILGIHMHRTLPLLLDIRFLHIDEALFEYGAVDALRSLPTYLSLNPSTWELLRSFFENVLPEKPIAHTSGTHFRRVDTEQRQTSYENTLEIPQPKHVYRYFPDMGVYDEQILCTFQFPQWSPEHALNQTTTLRYRTMWEEQKQAVNQISVERRQRQDKASIVTFNQPTLEEFIILLKQYSYENFLHPQ